MRAFFFQENKGIKSKLYHQLSLSVLKMLVQYASGMVYNFLTHDDQSVFVVKSFDKVKHEISNKGAFLLEL